MHEVVNMLKGSIYTNKCSKPTTETLEKVINQVQRQQMSKGMLKIK